MRVTVSTPPPAGTQTMILIGLFGKSAATSCAYAPDAVSSAANSPANIVRTCSSLVPAVLCHAGQFLRRQLEIEHLHGIAAKDIPFRLLGQEGQIIDSRG